MRNILQRQLAEFILNESPKEGTELKAVLSKDKESIQIKSSKSLSAEDVQ